MISRITGKLTGVSDDRATIEVNGIAYDVLVPPSLVRKLVSGRGEMLTLHTFHYLEGGLGGGNPIPRLAGFLGEVDREFFERFITVQGVGVKVALKALTIPIQSIATAIENRDAGKLATLPGIGKRTADKIVADLNGKMAKYALLKEGEEPAGEEEEEPDFKDEVTEVLVQLGYSRAESQQMIKQALAQSERIDTPEDLIRQIFRQRAAMSP